MMAKKLNFFLCSINIIPSVLHPAEPDPFSPIKMLEQAIIENGSFLAEGENLILFGNLVLDSQKTLKSGKIGIQRKRSKDSVNEEGFFKEEDVDYPNVYFVWDRERQHILIDKKVESKLKKITRFCLLLKSAFEGRFPQFQFHIGVVTEKESLWKRITEIIDSGAKVSRISFHLFAPNMLGKTDEDIREFLNNSKENIAMQETAITFQGDKKRGLNIYPDLNNTTMTTIRALDRTASRTGGQWRLRDTHGKSHRSTDHFKVISTEVKEVQVIEDANEILNNYFDD